MSQSMPQKRIPGGPLWMQWTRTIALLLLCAEYLRLVLMTEVASYRVAVTALLAVGFGISLVR